MMALFDPHELGLDIVSITGDEARCFCPFHDDQHPSASFNVQKGMFNCFVCGGYGAKRMARFLGGRVLMTKSLPSQLSKNNEREWRQLFSAPLAIDNHYLLKRGITNEAIEKYEIRQIGNVIGGRVLIPLFNKHGETIGFTARKFGNRKGPRYMLYGKKPVLWPLPALRGDKSVILVEGIFSAIKFREANQPAFATLGTAGVSRALEYIKGRSAISFFDRDFAGAVASAKALLSANIPYWLGSASQRYSWEIDRISGPKISLFVSEAKPNKTLQNARLISGHPLRFNKVVSNWLGRSVRFYQ